MVKITWEEYLRLKQVNTARVKRQLNYLVERNGGIRCRDSEEAEEYEFSHSRWTGCLIWLVLLCREYGYGRLPELMEEYFSGQAAWSGHILRVLRSVWQYNESLITLLAKECNDVDGLKALLLPGGSEFDREGEGAMSELVLRLLRPREGERLFSLDGRGLGAGICLDLLAEYEEVAVLQEQEYFGEGRLPLLLSLLEHRQERLQLHTLQRELRTLGRAEYPLEEMKRLQARLEAGQLQRPVDMGFGLNLADSDRLSLARVMPRRRLGTRGSRDEDERLLDVIMQELQLLRFRLNRGGRLVYWLLDDNLQRSRKYAVEARRRMVEELGLAAVIRLPEIRTTRRMATDLLIFSPEAGDGIRMVNASRQVLRDSRRRELDVEAVCGLLEEDGPCSRLVDRREIRAAQYNLSPLLHLAEKRERGLALGECCQFRRSPVIPMKELEEYFVSQDTADTEELYYYIAQKDINPAGLDPEGLQGLRRMRLEAKDPACQRLREAVVEEEEFILLGKNYPINVMYCNLSGWRGRRPRFIVNSNTYIVTAAAEGPRVPLRAVEMFLRGNEGQEEFDKLFRGSSVKMLSLSALRGICLPPLPEEEGLAKLLEEYEQLLRRRRVLEEKQRQLDIRLLEFADRLRWR